ncbi:Transcription factor bHLH69 [Dendrobium catenatum]|uniref:Transcription factor bHLH69 n=1 Tax=Dendrobium catenatum TaxID=906689 RepID=A0A2I0WCH4_9ASPA|nr:Transcription factor bHLH69 [Dendrobium catenatum]
MQPIRGEMRAMGTPVNGLPQSSKPSPSTAVSAQIAVHEFHNSIGHALIQNCNLQSTFSKFEPSPAATDDSLDEMISSIPSFPELIQCHWDLTDGTQVSGDEGLPFEGPYDESPLLTAWFRQQQIISEGLLVGIQTMLPISAQLPEGASMPQHSFGGSPPQAAPIHSTSAGANSGAARVAAPRKRVRARRGQATDPHSIAERPFGKQANGEPRTSQPNSIFAGIQSHMSSAAPILCDGVALFTFVISFSPPNSV